MKIVIVGGVAGGASAAARLRRLDENAEIIIFERSGFISYANCGLPYYVGGEITDKAVLTLQTPQSFWNRFRIDARVKHEVTDINGAEKKVTVKNLETGEVFEEAYDKLILSPGAKPIVPAFAEDGTKNLFTLRTVEDTFKIREFVDENKPKSAVVIGGGFIGLEVAENLKNLGMDVTLVQKDPHLLNTMDSDMASFIHAKVKSCGIKLFNSSNVTKVKNEGGLVVTTVENMGDIKSDMAVMAIGVAPDSTLAKLAGIETGLRGAIVVNDKMETSVKDIYAVGDAVEVKHFVTGEKAVISLAGPANKQGRIVADNICGIDSKFGGSQGSSIIKIFDMTAAATGLTESAVKEAGIDYEKVILSPPSHATYYPGAEVMTVKVMYEKKTCKLLGAQIVGFGGVDKRIDVLATAIRAGMKADELKDLELAYAPPYSSAKDPVNMAGLMIDNIEAGLVKQAHYEDLEELRKQGNGEFIDVRTPDEWAAGHIDGFKHIPLDSLREHLAELDKNKKIYVSCQSGMRSYFASRILALHGFDCYNMGGGYRFYNSVNTDKEAAREIWDCGMEKK